MEWEKVRAAILCIFVEERQSLNVEGGASLRVIREMFRRRGNSLFPSVHARDGRSFFRTLSRAIPPRFRSLLSFFCVGVIGCKCEEQSYYVFEIGGSIDHHRPNTISSQHKLHNLRHPAKTLHLHPAFDPECINHVYFSPSSLDARFQSTFLLSPQPSWPSRADADGCV
jgi:hypothetical protein